MEVSDDTLDEELEKTLYSVHGAAIEQNPISKKWAIWKYRDLVGPSRLYASIAAPNPWLTQRYNKVLSSVRKKVWSDKRRALTEFMMFPEKYQWMRDR